MREKQTDKQGLYDLVNSLSADNMKIVEVGSYCGESAEIFINTGKVAKVVCIDPWTTILEKDGGNTYRGMDAVERSFDSRMAKYGEVVEKFKGTYYQYLSSIPENSIAPDLVYIDAIHTYDACKADIENTLKFLKPKIAIAGHDYADLPLHIVGVKLAVNEVFGKPDLVFCDTSWLKFLA